MTRESVEQCLEDWILRDRGRISGEWARNLTHNFLYEWDVFDYKFHSGRRDDIEIAGLTVKVISDIRVEIKPGVYVSARWWLREEGPMSDLRRQGIIALLNEVRRRQIISDSYVGVWDMGRGRLERWSEVPEEFTSAIHATAEQVVKLWGS